MGIRLSVTGASISCPKRDVGNQALNATVLLHFNPHSIFIDLNVTGDNLD
jgi:hypothetical protein